MTSIPADRAGRGPATGPLTILAQWVMLTAGWRRLAVAAASGAAGALAMPPFGLFPALVVSLSVAVWLVDGAATGRRATRGAVLASALIGWAWGFGYLTAGLWWLGSAFLVEAKEFLWALPLGVVGLPAVLALFYAFGFAVARLLWSRGALRIVSLALGLSACEWMRGHLFTGFPWNTLGMGLGQNLWLMQGASVVGLYGLTFLAILVAAAPATLAVADTWRGRFVPLALAALALAGLAGFGALRVPAAADPVVAGVRLRLVQPNLNQDAKFRPENRQDILDRYLELSDRAAAPDRTGIADVSHVIWPESAFPFLIQRDPEALARIAAAFPPGKQLITGAARAEVPVGDERPRFFNSILTISAGPKLGDIYDKVHLVPFGEYLPGPLDATLRALRIRQFVSIPGGFTAGDRATQRIMTVPGLPPVAATICYEAIFPGAIVPGATPNGPAPVPGLILNLTNDAWFGDTPGPRQHLAQARLRAVEEGLPLVRDANTGISAVIDAHGRITASLPLGVEGVLDAALPARLAGRTVYASLGDLPFALIWVGAFLTTLMARRRSA
ncbi:acyltransferase [Methylobacterium sp. Leaf104]|uniref:apolipoprotein N-acyltransferase n=1 Tax=Methylobacterium TaxID=407 RepID=UPI0006F2B4B3|nr:MULTISPECIES: apolipoprotein N-acyltransferase [Methylobacterium]KQP31843.1 acyltransferase [Methylobacterium sp. Leaf104]MCI9880775.1 apolipoprotein N-acyltransferase [Methylobacterium goesingense]